MQFFNMRNLEVHYFMRLSVWMNTHFNGGRKFKMSFGFLYYINDMISIITRRGTTFWLLLVIAMMTAVIHPPLAQTHPSLSEKQQTPDTAKPEKTALKMALLHAAGMTGTYIYFI
ncbi:MAG: hypothetical protein R3C26_08255 [Calditrichia bacterium]